MHEDHSLFQLYKDISLSYFKYDDEAIKAKQEFVNNWQKSVYLGTASALFLTVCVSFSLSHVSKLLLAIVEVILFFLFWYYVRLIVNKEMNHKRIQIRLKAEQFRLLRIFCLSCLQFDLPGLSNLVNQGLETEKVNGKQSGTKQPKDLQQKILQLTTLLNDKAVSRPFIENTAHANFKFITEEQIEYHIKRKKDFAEKLGVYDFYLRLFKYTFLICLVGHLLISLSEVLSYPIPELVHNIFQFLLLAIPPVYFAIEGFIYFNELKRASKQSAEMINFFNSKKIELETEGSDTKSIVLQISAEMLKENANWELLF